MEIILNIDLLSPLKMSSYLKMSISLQAGNNKWRVYLRDVLHPLIVSLRLQKELLRFNLTLYLHEQPSVTIGLLFKTISVNDMLERVERQIQKLDVKEKDYIQRGEIVDVKQIAGAGETIQNKGDVSILDAVSYAILGALLQEKEDADFAFTYGLNLLFAAYSYCPDVLQHSVSKTIYEDFMAKAPIGTLAKDQIFHKVKYHVLKPSLAEAYNHARQLGENSPQWLYNFSKDIAEIFTNLKDEAGLIKKFVAFVYTLKTQLGLNETSISLINYFIYQTLSKSQLGTEFIGGKILHRKPALTKTKRSGSSKIPLLTYYSASHKHLFDNFFYPSFQKYLADDFELFVLRGAQLCDAQFEAGNWNRQVKEKIVFVNEFIQKTNSDYVVFSDVDIIFYTNIYNQLMQEIATNDMAFQNDSINGQTNNLCSGFYCCRVNKNTRAFFKKMLEEYLDNFSDQQNLNFLLSREGGVKYKVLSDVFYNFSYADGSIWFNNKSIAFPPHPVVLYHANYTVGTANKHFLLQTFTEWNNKFFNT